MAIHFPASLTHSAACRHIRAVVCYCNENKNNNDNNNNNNNNNNSAFTFCVFVCFFFAFLFVLFLPAWQINVLIIPGQCLWCCHCDRVIARVHPVHAMNAKQHQMAADQQTWAIAKLSLSSYETTSTIAIHCPQFTSYLSQLSLLPSAGLRRG